MKKERKTLRKIFLAAVLGAGVSMTGAANAVESISGLTDGEKTLVSSVFGNELNAVVPQKMIGDCEDKDNAMEVHPNSAAIHICQEKYYSEDYSREKNIFNYGSFMHEMTHIWQDYGTSPGAGARCYKVYDYSLDNASKFSDFCDEQQASIIEDYARRFLYAGYGYFRRLPNTQKNDYLLQKVVEEKFPAARKTRLEKENGKKYILSPNS